MLFVQLGTELYRDLGKADGTSALSATLEFDGQQRIVNIKNPFVDGVLKVPPFDTIVKLNELAQPMASLPKDQKLNFLTIKVKDGQINTEVKYLVK